MQPGIHEVLKGLLDSFKDVKETETMPDGEVYQVCHPALRVLHVAGPYRCLLLGWTFLQLEPEDMVAKVLNCKSKTSMTVLLRAVDARNYDVAETLLLAKADANIQNSRGMTALHVAAALRPPDMTLQELLVLHGADGQVTTKVRLAA